MPYDNICNGYSGYAYSAAVIISAGEVCCPACDGFAHESCGCVAAGDSSGYCDNAPECQECKGTGRVDCEGCEGCPSED